VCVCVCVCVICAGWMRVSAVLYVAKKEFFARRLMTSRFIQKVRKKADVDDVGRVMFLLFSSPFI
jgi:hypothetical protein